VASLIQAVISAIFSIVSVAAGLWLHHDLDAAVSLVAKSLV
jgi:hypothetical protein